jgi:hypothetical protein
MDRHSRAPVWPSPFRVLRHGHGDGLVSVHEQRLFRIARMFFSLLLMTVLIGMWSGVFPGRLSVEEESNAPQTMYIYSQILFQLFVLLSPAGFFVAFDRIL